LSEEQCERLAANSAGCDRTLEKESMMKEGQKKKGLV
jgi:hypothetical protein